MTRQWIRQAVALYIEPLRTVGYVLGFVLVLFAKRLLHTFLKAMLP